MEKELFSLIPCSTAGRVAIGHPICIVNVTHVTVIIRHNCWLHRIPVFVAIIAFSGWILNMSGGVRLFCPSKLQVISHLSRISPHFSLSVLGMWPGPQQNFFLGQVVIQVRGGKEAVHIVYAQILLPPLSDLSLYYVLLSDVRCCSALSLSLPR